MEVEVERIFNQQFGGFSFELDVIINSTSSDATEFISLGVSEHQARTGGRAFYYPDSNRIITGSSRRDLSRIAAHEIGHALGLADRYYQSGIVDGAPVYTQRRANRGEIMADSNRGNFSLNELRRIIAIAHRVENGSC